MSEWQGFYVIVGPSAAALIGMQFVVMTLIAARPRHPTEEAFAAFATPTVVHLAVALVTSAVMSVSWRSPAAPFAVLIACGTGGVIYGAIVIARVRRQTFYETLLEDWIWYAVLPSADYAGLVAGAVPWSARQLEAVQRLPAAAAPMG